MFKNYLKIALRNLLRHRGYTFINIVSLAIGMACCLLILFYIRNELSYDRDHENADRIFRIGRISQSGDNVRKGARSTVPMGPALKADFPEITEVIRFWRAFNPVLSYQEKHFREDHKLYFTDPAVFDVFSFPLINGNPHTALESPNTIVISEAMAEKYFGVEQPMGKVINFRGYPAGELDLVVTGVMRDLPRNTHFEFEFLASLVGVETERTNWGSSKPIWTYVFLPQNYPPEKLESKLPGFADRYLKLENTTEELHLEPLESLHLFSDYPGSFKAPGNLAYIYLFSAIGFFILLIACVNFMNLATARSLARAKEVAVRKVLGAYRIQLIKQFVGEALFLSYLALALAIMLIEVLLPVFNTTFNLDLVIDYFQDWFVLLCLAATVPVVGLLAGCYPALFLSRLQPIAALKGRFVATTSGNRLRKGLIVFQFVVSIVLISGTLMIYNQLDYVQNKNLGFGKEQVVVVPYGKNDDVLIAAMLRHPNIMNVSISQRVPVNLKNSDVRIVVPQGFVQPFRVQSYITDEYFLDTYKIELATGSNLSSSPGIANQEFMINETAAKEFGWTPEQALGKRLLWSGDKNGRVVGVIKDFHMASLHERIRPLVLHTIPGDFSWQTFISIRIGLEDLQNTLRFIEKTWKKFTPNDAYEYFFIDESLDLLHRDDQRFGKIFSYFAILAILIACMGLFGLASFTAEQRTKEIGIRKVLGASISNVVLLLSKEFTKLVGVAFLLAVPIAFLVMERWLDNFAYRISADFNLFLLAGILALIIALLTVSYQSIRAALTNPVKALRYE